MFYFDKKIICPTDPTVTSKRIEEYKKYYSIKYNICKMQDPKYIAEIGIRAGYSAWTFLQACPNAKYIGFDANNGTHGGRGGEDGSFFKWTHKILKGYDYVLQELDTQIIFDLGLKDVDFFHVDGDHTKEGVCHDLDLAFKAIGRCGLILVDDYDHLHSVHIGIDMWLKDNEQHIKYEFRESFRGEVLIWKKLNV